MSCKQDWDFKNTSNKTARFSSWEISSQKAFCSSTFVSFEILPYAVSAASSIERHKMKMLINILVFRLNKKDWVPQKRKVGCDPISRSRFGSFLTELLQFRINRSLESLQGPVSYKPSIYKDAGGAIHSGLASVQNILSNPLP